MTDLYTETTTDDDTAVDEVEQDAPEQVERVDVNETFEAAVEATLAALRTRLLNDTDDADRKVRKSIPMNSSDRRKVRRRHVDTDVPASDLVYDALLELLRHQDEVTAASARAVKNRTERLTVTAPAWWWKLAYLSAHTADASLSDVLATAVNKRLA